MRTQKLHRNWKTHTLTLAAIIATIGFSTTSILATTPLAPTSPEKTILPTLIQAGENTTQVLQNTTRYVKGLNDTGQLGVETGQRNYYDWGSADNDLSFVKLDGKYTHTVGLTETGEAYAWGDNKYRQTGVNSANPTYTPNQLKVSAPYKALAAGTNYVLAVDISGNLMVWGNNEHGQLGTGKPGSEKEPVHILPTQKFFAVATSQGASYAIDTENNVWAWGLNTDGQLGVGDLNNRTEPTQIPNLKLKQIVGNQAGNTMAGINLNNQLVMWGANTHGQLGVGVDWRQQQADENKRVADEIARIKQEDTTMRNSLIEICEADRERQVKEAEEKNKKPDPTPTPTPTPGVDEETEQNDQDTSTIKQEDVPIPTWDETCAQEVDKTFTPRDTSNIKPKTIKAPALKPAARTPIVINPTQTFTSVAVGVENAYAVDANNTLYGWGYDKNGQTGLGLDEDTHTQVPVKIGDGFRVVSSGIHTAATVTTGNTLQIFGYGAKTGITLNNEKLLKPTSMATNVKTVTLNGATGFYTDLNNNGFAWGDLTGGLNGAGPDQQYTTTPQIVPVEGKYNLLTNAGKTGLGLNTNNQLVLWGTNNTGLFGNGETSNTPTATERVIIDRFLDIASGDNTTILIDENGVAWVVGAGLWGQAGPYGVREKNMVPVPVPIPGKVKLATAGVNATWVVDENNTVWVWGYDNPTPTKVGTHTHEIQQITANDYAVQILDTAGKVYEYSLNGYGVLEGTTPMETGFSSVPFNNEIKAIAGSGSGGLAITTTGEVWAWGSETRYAAVDENTFVFNKPVLVDDTRKYEQISASLTHILLLDENSMLFGAGFTIDGTFGLNGHSQYKVTPISTVIKGEAN